MMYSNKLACAIKVNDKILRESNGTVQLPFGTEYSILIKNLNTVRAQVDISIDGNSIGDGDSVVVEPNSSVTVKRFLRGNNDAGHSFKFIERTEEIDDFREIGESDGLVHIQYQFAVPSKNVYDMLRRPATPALDFQYKGPAIDPMFNQSPASGILRQCVTTNSTTLSDSSHVNQATSGITVNGSISNQKFNIVEEFELEVEKHSMVLMLCGKIDTNNDVQEAVVVRSKSECPTCGKFSKSSCKFCSVCGTNIQRL